MSNGINESLWEFPCDHNFKVMGLAHHPLADIVRDVVQLHALNTTEVTITTKSSSSGKYISITAQARITTKEQLEAIYVALDLLTEVHCTL